jgi:hypothetical protein
MTALDVLYILAVTVQIWFSAFVSALLFMQGHFIISGMLIWFVLNGVFALYRMLVAPPREGYE